MIHFVKLSLLVLFLFHGAFAHASKKIISSNKPLPLEFILLLESIQKAEQTLENKLEFDRWILSLDESFSALSKEEIFFICKAEIYKAILKKYKTTSPELKRFDIRFLKTAMAKIEQVNSDKVRLSLFSKWMIQALLSDLKILLTAPQNLNFVVYVQNDTNITEPAFNIWSKKMNMVAPWIDVFLNSIDSEFETIVKPLQLEILQTIAIYADLLIKQSRFKDTWPKKKSTLTNLNFFMWKEFEEKKNASILADDDLVPQGSGSSDSPSAMWTPKESPDSTNLPKLPRGYPTPDPDYLPPQNLPAPVNDWIQAQ